MPAQNSHKSEVFVSKVPRVSVGATGPSFSIHRNIPQSVLIIALLNVNNSLIINELMHRKIGI